MRSPESVRNIARAVREACLEAARQGYDQAALSGLCHEGAVECSLDAIRMVDVEAIIEALDSGQDDGK